MFVGHAAFALIVKARRPRPPMVLLLAAAFGPDLVEWGFAAAGYHDRVLSHSIIAVGAGGLIAALAYVALAKASRGDAVAVAGLWLSHWPADFLTGVKPTWPGGPMAGLNLYTLPAVDLAMESAIVLVAWLVYRNSVKSRRSRQSLLIPVGLIAAQCVFVMLLWWSAPLHARFAFLHLSR
jgi:hypothetical protein